MTAPDADRQVARALADLGWTETRQVFGANAHPLEQGIGTSQTFRLAPLNASEPSSIDFKAEPGEQFLHLLSMYRRILSFLFEYLD